MGIAPIDLQTMYSQMSNVAKVVADKQQGAQLATQLQENNVIRQNEEKAQTVQKAADDEAKSMGVNQDGNGNNSSYQQGKKKENHEEDSLQPSKPVEIREAYLGRHIDISR